MATKRKTIGANPLDAVIGGGSAGAPTAASKASRKGLAPAGDESKPGRSTLSERVMKERLTVHLPLDLIRRVKNAVYWERLTLAGFAEEALTKAVDALEKKNGKAFEQEDRKLKGGRPMKRV